MKKIDWIKVLNPIISGIFDPMLNRAAQRFVSSIPESSWFNTDTAQRILAVLKGIAESYKGPGISGLFIEKVTDFFDFSSGVLSNKKAGSDFSSIAQRWMNKFFEEAQKTLASTPADKLDEVKDRLKKEFELRKEIFNLVCEAEKEFRPKKPAPQPIDWAALDQKAAAWLQNNRPSWIRRRPRRNQ
jgi:hypothetical protein